MNKNLLIVGAGAYGVIASNIAHEMGCFEKIDFVDDGNESTPTGEKVIGKIKDLAEINSEYSNIVVAIDSPDIRLNLLFIHPGFIANGIDSGNNNGNNNGNNYGNEHQLDNAERILKIMKDTPQITIYQIVSDTGISKRTVSRIIKELKGKDMIRREGTKNGTWIVLQ